MSPKTATIVIIALLAVLTACGKPPAVTIIDRPDGQPAPQPAPESVPAPEPTPQPAPESAPTSQLTLEQNSTVPAGNTIIINMTARQFAFEPDIIRVRQGDHVIIHVTSTDVRHGLGIKDYGINVQFDKGETKTVRFTADKKGAFTYRCTVPCGSGHMEMEGTLVVE